MSKQSVVRSRSIFRKTERKKNIPRKKARRNRAPYTSSRKEKGIQRSPPQWIGPGEEGTSPLFCVQYIRELLSRAPNELGLQIKKRNSQRHEGCLQGSSKGTFQEKTSYINTAAFERNMPSQEKPEPDVRRRESTKLAERDK